jgi:hypothetical protein
MARWRRVAGPFERNPKGDYFDFGWTWRIAAEGVGTREITVEVARSLDAVDLPADSREAISTRGASAVDKFLNETEPPPRILVLSAGVQARDLY